MRVAVIGGSGFIGTHTTQHMLDSGVDVTVIDKVKPRLDVKWKRADILYFNEMYRALQGFDYVYNLAAISCADECEERASYSIKTNIMGLTNVLEACVHNKVKRILFSSSV